MIFSIDLWHGKWGFGFTIVIWERMSDKEVHKLAFYGQIKGFGKSREGEWLI